MTDKPDRIIRESEVLHLTSISKSQLRLLEMSGDFPARRKLSPRISGFSENEVQRWIHEKLHAGADHDA